MKQPEEGRSGEKSVDVCVFKTQMPKWARFNLKFPTEFKVDFHSQFVEACVCVCVCVCKKNVLEKRTRRRRRKTTTSQLQISCEKVFFVFFPTQRHHGGPPSVQILLNVSEGAERIRGRKANTARAKSIIQECRGRNAAQSNSIKSLFPA